MSYSTASHSTASDVSAVVVHQQEPYLDRALASIGRQTLRPAAVILADPETEPVHRAINEVVARVETPYLVQVDADMILDPDCFERLRRGMPAAGVMAIGRLRDPLAGRIGAIKLYASRLFREGGMPDSISPDADFQLRFRRRRQIELHVLKFGGPDPRLWHTLGVHDPGYTDRRAFGRYFHQGNRYAYRRDPLGLRSLFRRLRRSHHPAAIPAQAGAAAGLFCRQTSDVRIRLEGQPGFEQLETILQRDSSQWRGVEPIIDDQQPLDATFLAFYRHGAELAAHGCRQDLEASCRRIDLADSLAHWFALVGLLRGLLDAAPDERAALQDARWLSREIDLERSRTDRRRS